MKRFRRFVAFFVCAVLVAAVGVARAQHRNDPTLTYDFYDCTGPAPSSFTAVRDYWSAGSFDLTDGTAIFVGLIFFDIDTGSEFSPPGLDVSGNVTVSCYVTSPISGDTLLIEGFLTPAS